MTAPACRACGAALATTFVDLGVSPLSNAYVTPGAAGTEAVYPLHAFVCDRCFLVQITDQATREGIFAGDYAYFSSYSETWLAHARAFAAMAIDRFALDRSSRVVEIASNDGYLLQYFRAAGIPVLGVEPAGSVASAARARGIPTISAFFGAESARELLGAHGPADLIVANNVLAHVPDLHDFVAGLALLLGADGTATFEFPHVLELIRRTEFDTIYHEHYSYFSLIALEPVFAAHALTVTNAERLETHGGSLRLYVRHAAAAHEEPGVRAVRGDERAAGLHRIETYARFPRAVAACKRDALAFFARAKEAGKSIAGYGAPAKGNTFLNYCGVGTEIIPFTVDRNEHKVGKLLPGTGIPIRAVDAIARARPDYILVLPWNLRDEIAAQLAYVAEWGARFVTAVPAIEIRP